MKENLRTALLMTLVTTVIFGVVYPLGVTGLAQLLFPAQANGSFIQIKGQLVGSALLGQSFTSPQYFHSRPSAAGTGYDASQSGASNFGPTNHQLFDRVKADVDRLHAENPGSALPVDLVTASGSCIEPEKVLAAAQFQAAPVARARGMRDAEARALVNNHSLKRHSGFLAEPRVRVLELNLELDATHPM